ncbi:uncharacterized protein LOC117651805 isoform X2 [Thrips palmi]|uniref:Uncharacterized protein LOC117651805 isoform X2 n=1 Tax=Thrips palmi TaxID=161013 RepID=A0A6P9A2L5_THRPL|nr:uncharacterized protein LOC117651805 isoform X2 [Thrips palmi]
MEDLLKEWGVSDPTIIESFKANDIVVDDLSTLSEDDLRSLVPCIGPRNRIKRHIAMLLESSNNNSKQTVNSNPTKILLSEEASNTLGEILLDSEEATEENGERSNQSEGSGDQNERSEQSDRSGQSERSGSGSQSRTQSTTKARAEATKRPLAEAADIKRTV